MKKMTIALTLGFAILFAASSLAHAWPDQPPAKAFISGPGIAGQIQIADQSVLDSLRLGTFEDMQSGTLPAPANPGQGFHIIRYFDGGEFRFADITYYPNVAGARSMVMFQDGPQLQGDHTPYNGKWLYTNAAADHLIQPYIQKLGGILSANSSKPNGNETLQTQPVPISGATNTTQTANAVRLPAFDLPLLWIALVAVGLGILGFLARTMRQKSHQT